jgi:hypothetical protein
MPVRKRQITGKLLISGQRSENVTIIADDVDVGVNPTRPEFQQVLRGGILGIVNDDTLSDAFNYRWTLDASTWYAWEAVLFCREAGGGLKFQLNVDQTTQEGYFAYTAEDVSAVTSTDVQASAVPIISLTAMTNSDWFVLKINGQFLTHATLTSTCNLQVAQVTSGASATDVAGGSWMRVIEQNTVDTL